jgi:hypothetical protein
VNCAAGVLCIALAALTTSGQTRWRLLVTIEALQDVPAHAETGTGGQLRGVLYVGHGQAFTVKKEQRFLMVKIYDEGGCRIELEKRRYDVSSCPWLDGFTDHQRDVIRVVATRSSRTVPDKHE